MFTITPDSFQNFAGAEFCSCVFQLTFFCRREDISFELGTARSLWGDDRVRVVVLAEEGLGINQESMNLARVGHVLVLLELLADLEGLDAVQIMAVNPGLGKSQGLAVQRRNQSSVLLGHCVAAGGYCCSGLD